jgi:hypothetical protein
LEEEETERALTELQRVLDESRELRHRLAWGALPDRRFAVSWVQGWEECVTTFGAVFDNVEADDGLTWVEVLTQIEACRASLPRNLSPRVFVFANAALDDLWSAATAGLQGDRDLAALHALEARRKAAVLGGYLAN